MTITGVALAAKELKKRRDAVLLAEEGLRDTVVSFLETKDGSGRDLARHMEISAQYLCDIRHGRRKISDAVVEKLMKIKS